MASFATCDCLGFVSYAGPKKWQLTFKVTSCPASYEKWVQNLLDVCIHPWVCHRRCRSFCRILSRHARAPRPLTLNCGINIESTAAAAAAPEIDRETPQKCRKVFVDYIVCHCKILLFVSYVWGTGIFTHILPKLL